MNDLCGSLRVIISILSVSWLLASCGTEYSGRDSSEYSEIDQRPVTVLDYPQADNTYLSFSQSHGFQVEYMGHDGRSWLWYPGNSKVVPEQWRLDTVNKSICWKHPRNTRNPISGQSGGAEECESLALARKLNISKLDGDPFRLASGNIPAMLEKCVAPDNFQFDRTRYRCH